MDPMVGPHHGCGPHPWQMGLAWVEGDGDWYAMELHPGEWGLVQKVTQAGPEGELDVLSQDST